jgi:hypothetical protein
MADQALSLDFWSVSLTTSDPGSIRSLKVSETLQGPHIRALRDAFTCTPQKTERSLFDKRITIYSF